MNVMRSMQYIYMYIHTIYTQYLAQSYMYIYIHITCIITPVRCTVSLTAKCENRLTMTEECQNTRCLKKPYLITSSTTGNCNISRPISKALSVQNSTRSLVNYT